MTDTAEGLYVQYGCGLSVGEGWQNYDNSPTLRLTRFPGLAPLVRRAGGVKFPEEVRYGDICNGPLSAPGDCAGIYASHVLEHLTLEEFKTVLRYTCTMLKPGGIFRLIVPDLEVLARRYITLLEQRVDEANSDFMRSSCLGEERSPVGAIGRLRGVFGGSKHRWMWDEPSMTKALAEAGFVDIRRCEFNDCEDRMFKAVEDLSRFVDQGSNMKCLAIECRRPS